MADFCNQCATELGFPIGDLAHSDRPKVEPGFGYPELCEGCGPVLVDENGYCIDPLCDRGHGGQIVANKIITEFKSQMIEGTTFDALSLMRKLSIEYCGDLYDYTIMQIHDSYTVTISPKGKLKYA